MQLNKDLTQRLQKLAERTQRRKDKQAAAPFYALAATNAQESTRRRTNQQRGSGG